MIKEEDNSERAAILSANLCTNVAVQEQQRGICERLLKELLNGLVLKTTCASWNQLPHVLKPCDNYVDRAKNGSFRQGNFFDI